ncbi:hypothetical protein A6V39_02265 [Candidatus Mycoplasma haematobovis]|uniref:Uncharacterized protein n=1 Tax=Candidatus Mycoplasma haematobovis TaxID=432608 RepID=A0A1A9QE66_9MOLU|nr:hypothetical protein [Candidatus Mycoplasma haematobovis]OAL10246.1 hypothetical protein A6V39_02265 [Candidatus Mycoplasma haematobovis]
MTKLVVCNKDFFLNSPELFRQYKDAYFLTSEFKLYKLLDPLLLRIESHRTFKSKTIFKLDEGIYFSCSNKASDPICNLIFHKDRSIKNRFNGREFIFSIESLEPDQILEIELLPSYLKSASLITLATWITAWDLNITSYFYVHKIQKYLLESGLLTTSFTHLPMVTNSKKINDMPSFKNFLNTFKEESDIFGDLSLDAFDFLYKKKTKANRNSNHFFDENEEIDFDYLELLFEDDSFIKEIAKAKRRQRKKEAESYVSQIERNIARSSAFSFPKEIEVIPKAIPELPAVDFHYLNGENKYSEDSYADIVKLEVEVKSEVPQNIEGVYLFFDLEEIFEPAFNLIKIPDLEDEIKTINAYVDEAIEFYFKKEHTEPPFFSWEK